MRGGPRSFPRGFSCLVVLWMPPLPFPLRLRGFHPLWPVFPGPFRWGRGSLPAVRTPGRSRPGLGSSRFARRYSGNHFCFLFLRLLRCFSSPGSPRPAIRNRFLLHRPVTGGSPAGFPHSDTRGASLVCSSPRLFAACRVFLRLLVPRHPPRALSRLTTPFPPSVTVLGRRPSPSRAGAPFFLLSFARLSTRPRMSRRLSLSLETFDLCSVFGFQGTKGGLAPFGASHPLERFPPFGRFPSLTVSPVTRGQKSFNAWSPASASDPQGLAAFLFFI